MTKDTGGSAFPGESVVKNGMHSTVRVNNSGMTLRQYAAIKLRVPDSGLDWLDEMIREGRRMDYAGQALAGMLAANPPSEPDSNPVKAVARAAHIVADDMVAERNK